MLLCNAALFENQKNVAAYAHERTVPVRSVDHLEHDGAFSRVRSHLVEILPHPRNSLYGDEVHDL